MTKRSRQIDSLTLLITVFIPLLLGISLIFTLFIYNKQEKTRRHERLLLYQNQLIESVSRKLIQTNLLRRYAANQDFEIYNLKNEMEAQLDLLTLSIPVMLQGGDLSVDRENNRFSAIPVQYRKDIDEIKLLINAVKTIKGTLDNSTVSAGEGKLHLLTSIIGQLSAKNQSILRDLKKRGIADHRLFIISMVGTTGIVVLSFAFFMNYVIRILAKLRNVNDIMVNHMQDFAAGKADLTRRLNYSGHDEIGKVASSFDRFSESIRLMIVQTQTFSVSLQKTSEHLSALAEETNAASEEITGNISSVSKNAELQRDRIQSAAQAIAEQADSMKKFIHDFNEFIQVTHLTQTTAEKGGGIIRTGIGKMNLVFNLFEQIAKRVKELAAAIQEIVQFIEVITQITHQTNLLSLNAAIEAARAGDAGRGFTVVAGEIRTLAERTDASAQQIAAIVSRIQKENQATLEAMSTGGKHIASGREAMDQADDSLKKIVEAAALLEERISSMSNISKQQLDRIDPFRKITNEISMYADENASALEEISASMEELNNSMVSVKNSSQEISDVADALDESTRNMKTR
ncbi:MAG: methyl-accepting chemotaxis protein [candidate division FCPU426 bacterium]